MLIFLNDKLCHLTVWLIIGEIINLFIKKTHINTTPIISLYQKFYSINCIKTNNWHLYSCLRKDTLTNRDVYNCNEECINSKQLSEKYKILRKPNNKTKNIFCYKCNKYTESI